MPVFRIDWSHDLGSGVGDLTIVGLLDLHAAGRLRTAVLKALAEHPVTMLVDLDGVDMAEPTPVLVLVALDRQAATDHGVRLRCFVRPDHPQRARIEAAMVNTLSLYASREEAREAAVRDTEPFHRLRVRLAADAGSVRQARMTADNACAAWHIGSQADDVRIIVSELASNAVRHAGVDHYDLVLLLRRSMLYIQVIDTDPRLPVFAPAGAEGPVPAGRTPFGGRGMQLVQTLATGCGVTPQTAGKIVWATVRVRQAPAS